MPASLESAVGPCDALLADGSTVHVRPITGDDGDLLVAFHSTLSSESIHLRYFSAHAHLQPDEVHRFTHVDGRDRMALVATVRDDIIGVARYDRNPSEPDEAEVATEEEEGPLGSYGAQPAGGGHAHVIRIRPEFVSGRRICPVIVAN